MAQVAEWVDAMAKDNSLHQEDAKSMKEREDTRCIGYFFSLDCMSMQGSNPCPVPSK
jgi:hypothetical protein